MKRTRLVGIIAIAVVVVALVLLASPISPQQSLFQQDKLNLRFKQSPGSTFQDLQVQVYNDGTRPVTVENLKFTLVVKGEDSIVFTFNEAAVMPTKQWTIFRNGQLQLLKIPSESPTDQNSSLRVTITTSEYGQHEQRVSLAEFQQS